MGGVNWFRVAAGRWEGYGWGHILLPEPTHTCLVGEPCVTRLSCNLSIT